MSSVQQVMFNYRKELGGPTKLLSFREMAQEISKYRSVGQNTLYRWADGTNPDRWVINFVKLAATDAGWVQRWAADMLAALAKAGEE